MDPKNLLRSLTCWLCKCPEPISHVLMISAPCETQAQLVFSSKAWMVEVHVPYAAACSKSNQGCCAVLRLVLVISYSITVAECAQIGQWDTTIGTGASSPSRDCSSRGIRDRFLLVTMLVRMVLVSFSHPLLSPKS